MLRSFGHRERRRAAWRRRDVWLAAFHQEEIFVGRERGGARNGQLHAVGTAEVAFSRARVLRRTERVYSHRVRQMARVVYAEPLHLRAVLGELLLFALLRQLVRYGLFVAHDARFVVPLLVERRELRAGSAALDPFLQRVAQRFSLLRGAEQELVVARVGVRVQQRGRLRDSARYDNQLDARDIRRQTSRHHALAVLAHRHQHLAGHVSELLVAVRLVLEVHSCRAVLYEHPSQLGGRPHSAMARVAVRDDRVQEVNHRVLSALQQRHAKALLCLLAVVA